VTTVIEAVLAGALWFGAVPWAAWWALVAEPREARARFLANRLRAVEPRRASSLWPGIVQSFSLSYRVGWQDWRSMWGDTGF
jgi:hypothetical protein